MVSPPWIPHSLYLFFPAPVLPALFLSSVQTSKGSRRVEFCKIGPVRFLVESIWRVCPLGFFTLKQTLYRKNRGFNVRISWLRFLVVVVSFSHLRSKVFCARRLRTRLRNQLRSRWSRLAKYNLIRYSRFLHAECYPYCPIYICFGKHRPITPHD